MNGRAPSSRKRFQFGLRGLLLVMTLIALAAAWGAYLNRQANHRTKLHFRREPPPAVAAAMCRELPGIDLITPAAATGTYYQRRVSQPIFAFEGAAFLALLAAGLIGTAGLIVSRWRRYCSFAGSRNGELVQVSRP